MNYSQISQYIHVYFSADDPSKLTIRENKKSQWPSFSATFTVGNAMSI